MATPLATAVWMALPFALSELLVVSTALGAGKLSRELTTTLMNVYLLAIGVVVAVLIWRAAGSRAAAALLGYAGFSYALVAAFFAYMGFSGDWI